jgi:hypothetical protein
MYCYFELKANEPERELGFVLQNTWLDIWVVQSEDTEYDPGEEGDTETQPALWLKNEGVFRELGKDPVS